MKTISISGVIGWDVSPAEIRAELKDAGKEEIRVEISSPGGLVFDGLEIFNLIKNYPGKKTTHLMGLAASMASYIALAGDRVTAEANAVYMIHNAQGGAMGDHRDLRKTADIIEALSGVIASAYVKKTGKTPEDIAALMDGTTFLYGAEMKDAGFVDEIIGEPTTDKATACSLALASVSACNETVKKIADTESVSKIAAMLGEITAQKPVVDGPATAENSAANITSKESEMDIKQLKAEFPDLYQAVLDEGIKAEQTRREAIAAFMGINADGDKAVADAIASGKSFTDSFPTVQAAVMRGKSPDANGDNPPDIVAKTPENGAGVSGFVNAEDAVWAKTHGMSAEEFAKYSRKDGE